MSDLSRGNFGIVIAFLLPGLMGLWGLSHFSPTVTAWFGADANNAATVGGFLFVTICSVGTGLVASTLRWLVIDTVHHLTGIRQPQWDFASLQRNIDAFDRLIEIHYRYYQAYANSLVAMVFSYGCWRLSDRSEPTAGLIPEIVVLLLSVLLWSGSRDTLNKYYQRVAMLLGESDCTD